MNEPLTAEGALHHVAYVVLQFPKLSETFVVREMNGLREKDWTLSIYPLWFERTTQVHAEVVPLLDRVCWQHPLTLRVLAANIRMLRRKPAAYLSTLMFVASDFARHPVHTLKALALWPTMVWIAGDLERRGINHVHAHFASFATLAALVARRIVGISYSFTTHAFDLYVSPSQLRAKMAGARLVVTISEYNRRLLQALVPDVSTPIHVIHCGVRVPPELPPISKEPARVLCVARLEEKKGHRYLVEACRLLAARSLNFRCRLVGSGPYHDMLARQIADGGLGDVVELLGARTAEDVQQELAKATLFVLPSIVTGSGNTEGISVALMEAMAAGVPVIATEVSGTPELIDNGVSGLLVPPADAPAIAAAIERLLNDSELRERLRAAAFDHVKHSFRLETTVGELVELFEQVVFEPEHGTIRR